VFTALLDTCVLWPSLQRDFLLSLAVEGLYRPIWSAAILDECEMRRAFDDAEVAGGEGLDGTYGLPDPDDEHVVAAAVVGGAGAIITLNLRDFPKTNIPAAIQVLSPRTFAANTVELRPTRALAAIHAIAARSGRSGQRLTVPGVLDLLADRYGMDQVAELIRPLL